MCDIMCVDNLMAPRYVTNDSFDGFHTGSRFRTSGADIANICNEAAIVCARRNGPSVEMEDLAI